MIKRAFIALVLSTQALAAETPPPPPPAPQGLGAFAAVMGGLNLLAPPRPMLSYNGSIAPDANAGEVSQHRLNILVPVFKNEKDQYAIGVNAGQLHLKNREVLNKTSTVMPHDFYRSEIGLQYSHEISEVRHLGLRGSLGYASDKPFEGGKDLAFSVNGSFSFPGKSENSFWVLTMFLSNNNPIVNYIPIPGFIYFMKRETFTAMFGLPIASIQWTPAVPWTFSFSLFGPLIGAEAAYGFGPRTQIFVGSNWSQQSFFRKDRSFEDDRVIFEEKRALTGFRSPIAKFLSAELQLGHAFDRYIYEGDGFLNRDRGSARLEDSWFAQANLRAIF